MFTLTAVPSDPQLAELIGALNSIGSGMGFRNTERALSAVSGAVARAWQNSVGSDYRIQREKVTPFHHKVWSNEKMVHWLEKGLPAYDMKRTHPFGKKGRTRKAKTGKNGERITSWTEKRKDGSTYTAFAGDPYLIIPFRHRVKGAGQEGKKSLEDVYPDVQRQMQQPEFRRSVVTRSAVGSGKVSPNYNMEQIERATYRWGSRFQFPDTEEYRNLQGLVAMGRPKHTQFMSFRVVSVNSPAGSWLHPGIRARHYLQNIVERGAEKTVSVIEEALKRDIGQ